MAACARSSRWRRPTCRALAEIVDRRHRARVHDRHHAGHVARVRARARRCRPRARRPARWRKSASVSPATARSAADITRSWSASWRWRRCCWSAPDCCWPASSQATQIDLGFETDGRVAAELNLVPEYVRAARGWPHRSGEEDPVRQRRHRAAARGTAGVRAAAASFTSPLTGAPNRGISIEGDPAARLRTKNRTPTSRS